MGTVLLGTVFMRYSQASLNVTIVALLLERPSIITDSKPSSPQCPQQLIVNTVIAMFGNDAVYRTVRANCCWLWRIFAEVCLIWRKVCEAGEAAAVLRTLNE
jgi:hypothetical protein